MLRGECTPVGACRINLEQSALNGDGRERRGTAVNGRDPSLVNSSTAYRRLISICKKKDFGAFVKRIVHPKIEVSPISN